MTFSSATDTDLRQDLERLVSHLFESDSCGAIPPLEIDRRDGRLVISARLPSSAGNAETGVEVRLALGCGAAATQPTPRTAASESISAPPAAVPATAA